MSFIGTAAGATTVFVVCLFVRLAIIWSHRHRGCDAYYFLLCAETYRKEKRLPITLPNIYTLENSEQWYPPGFSVFLSWFPEKWLKEHYWLVSPVLDSLLGAGVYVAVARASGSVWIAGLAGVMYALNCASIPDTTSLNSRPLGAILFTATIGGLLLAFWWQPGGWWRLLALVLGFWSSILLLLTHKLSAQMLYVLLPVLAIGLRDWGPALWLIGVVLGAFGMFPKPVWKIWLGQYDILKFWARNWKQLGAHAVYGSSMYPELAGKDSRRIHQGGWRGLGKGITYMGMNAFALPALLVLPSYAGLSGFERELVWWTVGTYSWALATQTVPWLKFLGEGYRYLKLAAVPVAYLAVLPIMRHEATAWYWAALGIAFSVAVGLLLKVYVFMGRGGGQGTTVPFVDTALGKMMDRLRVDEGVRMVMCLPDSLGDAVGYYVRKPVLRGTHNLPFERVAPFFPTLRLPVELLGRGYGVSHLLLDRKYATEQEIELGRWEGLEKMAEDGGYVLYRTPAASAPG